MVISVLMSQWPCTIEITWVKLMSPDPRPYKQGILANCGQNVCPHSTQASNARPVGCSKLSKDDTIHIIIYLIYG